MQFSTASKKTDQDSTIGLFVALYLILLAFFIILTKDLSFNEYKQTTAMRSLYETFGRPKEQLIVFGRLSDVQLEDYSIRIEKLVRGYGTVETNNNQDLIKVTIPLDAIYYGDEDTFRNDKLNDMMNLTSLIKNWADSEQIRISLLLGETNIEQDSQRLKFFHERIFGNKPMAGVQPNGTDMEITIERDL